MSFTEQIKLQVKKASAFKCCRCQEIGVDVHHIIPQKDGGSDDFDNAAPLCQNCHSQFGSNPEKRKEIRQMRDWCYEVVKEKYISKDSEKYLDLLERIDKQIQEIKDGSKKVYNLMNEFIAFNTINPTDDKSTIKRKITEIISPNYFLLGGYCCPFCHKDLTIEIRNEVVNERGLLIDTIKVNCPYCFKSFNLRNII